MSNHLGNVLQVITDRKLTQSGGMVGQPVTYLADVVSQSDYFPFGMELPNQGYDPANPTSNVDQGEYRYSFQGQEKDDEIKGEGNSVNYKYRMHDPRVGRFFAVDPLASQYPHNGPYNFSENRVIDGLELEGLEVYVPNADRVTYYPQNTTKGQWLNQYVFVYNSAASVYNGAADLWNYAGDLTNPGNVPIGAFWEN